MRNIIMLAATILVGVVVVVVVVVVAAEYVGSSHLMTCGCRGSGIRG